MTIQSTLGSVAAALARNPLPCALIAGIATKITQMAISSVFRGSTSLSLISRASQVPGGQLLVNYGASVFIALATGVLLRCYRPTIEYQPIHNQVDEKIRLEIEIPCRSRFIQYQEKGMKTYICSNYPKRDAQAHNIFCDAFGYTENDQIQIAAIADGCGWGKAPQRAARAMVDHFIHFVGQSRKGSLEKNLVLDIARRSQQQIEKSHQEDDPHHFYGATTFLGGLIFKATNGKRYFTGVNCGDCKLYLLTNGKFIELTKPSRTDPRDSGGKFGPHREPYDKTEYAFNVEVKPGDKLLFMTDGVHDNLDKTPPERGMEENLGEADRRKLSTLQEFRQDDDIGHRIMEFVFFHTEKYLSAMDSGQNMHTASRRECPGKPDHMTLMVVTVKN